MAYLLAYLLASLLFGGHAFVANPPTLCCMAPFPIQRALRVGVAVHCCRRHTLYVSLLLGLFQHLCLTDPTHFCFVANFFCFCFRFAFVTAPESESELNPNFEQPAKCGPTQNSPGKQTPKHEHVKEGPNPTQHPPLAWLGLALAWRCFILSCSLQFAVCSWSWSWPCSFGICHRILAEREHLHPYNTSITTTCMRVLYASIPHPSLPPPSLHLDKISDPHPIIN